MTSTKTTEELLSENKYWSYQRTDRNGTRYFSDCRCGRCGGKGIIECYGFIEGGKCFECWGSGIANKPEIIKVYTPDHEAQLEAARVKRAAERKAAKEKDYREHMTEKLQNLGFGIENGIAVCYRVVGNTYEIKDKLKALGCKFKPSLGWYCAHNLEEYETQRLLAAEVCYFNPETISIDWVEDAEVKKLWIENKREPAHSKSEWVGEIGERIAIKVHIDKKFESEYRVHNGPYGTRASYMYIMHDENENVYKWSSSCDYKDGEDYYFDATVKDHLEYVDKSGIKIKQTIVTRCKEK